MKLPAPLRRYRHSRGFGIHSPSAYAFIREVLNPARGYAYYDYPSLRRRPGCDPQLLFRMAVKTNPATFRIDGGDRAARAYVREIIGKAVSGASETDGDADLLISLDRETTATMRFKNAFFADRRNPLLAREVSARTAGHIFFSRRAAVVIDSAAPFQTFDVAF